MNYQECRAYIDDSAKYGSVLGLDNMREMLDRLGNPQDAVPYVHVAGTNGKGSVIAYLYTTLTRAGYKVGRYISPTLYSYRERLEIAGEKISQEAFAKYVTEISRSIDQMTAVGMEFFLEEQCDIVVLEVGLGGRLDSTNVIPAPEAAVITKKLQVPCVVSDPDEAVLEKESVFGQTFSYKGEEFAISLAGVYQKENAVLALNALEELDRLGWTTTMEQRKDGLLHTSWKGRFTVINKKPLFIVDGAHNAGAADKMAESVRHYFNGKKLIYIMGVFADKEYKIVLEKTAHFAEKIYTIETPDNPRALPAEELAKAARVYNSSAESTKSIKDAVEKAFSCAGDDENSVILAFGSLSFIGALTNAVEEYVG